MENKKQTYHGMDYEEARAFLYDEDNAYKCDKCPERREGRHDGQLPCGQYNCWVKVTCHPDWFRW